MTLPVVDDPKQLPAGAFVPLMKVRTQTATAGTEIIENVKRNSKRNLPRIHTLPGWMSYRDPKEQIALVGGGPSLKNNLDKLRTFKDMIICGSPNDYIMEQGIIPKYVAVCDPDAIMAKYLTKTHENVTYLVASGCHDAVFDALKGRNIVIWHCHSDEYAKEMQACDEEYFGIGGGCTIGLRGLSIAVLFKYQDIHLFGFDSCMSAEEHHAYKFATDEEQIGEIYEIKVGSLFDGAEGASKSYHCAGYQLAQAEQFKMFYSQYGRTFRPTFYGGGLLEETARVVEEETHRTALMQQIVGMPDMSNFRMVA